MWVKDHSIHRKTIVDDHLEELIRHSYKFYPKPTSGKEYTHFQWRQLVQNTVNHIINEFYQLPLKTRSSLKVLELIQRYWIKRVDLFDSKAHYYTVLAKITDHLLRNLISNRHGPPPVFLFEKFNTWIEELQIHLSMTFQVAEWTNKSFVIKKYIVDDKEDVLLSFQHLAVVFCQKAFQTLPERIEVISLLSGKTHQYYPKADDVRQALDYLLLVKHLLQGSKTHLLTECKGCNFKTKQVGGTVYQVKEK
jgi:hypothetical protein